jgi:acyl dehydratase
MGSSGLDKLRWLAPVRPDDRLTASIEITKTRASDTKPDRGKVFWRAQVKNQDDTVVMTIDAAFMVGRRPAA